MLCLNSFKSVLEPIDIMSWSAHPLVKAFRYFVKQHKLYNKGTIRFIGKDPLGNKYFEADRPNHPRRISRYYETVKLRGFDDLVKASHVPPAWDSWLRFKRTEPPSIEEVLKHEEYFKAQQEMAANKMDTEGSNSLKIVDNDKKRTIPKGSYSD